MNKDVKLLLRKQGYALAGLEGGVKLCTWLKKSLKDEGHCYKQEFYGVESHRCLQCAPCINTCSHKCVFCWRPTQFTDMNSKKFIINAKEKGLTSREVVKELVNEMISAQRRLIQGFKGNPKTNQKKFEEALNPSLAAISLSGEPTLYPFLPELIEEFKSRNIKTFLVSNGTNPNMIQKLINDARPSQLYITLPACDEKIYLKTCNPLVHNGFKLIKKTLKILGKHPEVRSVIRLTLVKNVNMFVDVRLKECAEKYARLISLAKPWFIECKAYVRVGNSRERTVYENMPSHKDVKEFSIALSNELKKLGLNYPLKLEKKDSRVTLLTDRKDNMFFKEN